MQPASYISVVPSSGKFWRTTSDILQYVCVVHRWLQCFLKLFTTFAKDDFFLQISFVELQETYVRKILIFCRTFGVDF